MTSHCATTVCIAQRVVCIRAHFYLWHSDFSHTSLECNPREFRPPALHARAYAARNMRSDSKQSGLKRIDREGVALEEPLCEQLRGAPC